MTLLGLLRFAVECFDVLAWPLFALLYPLYSSIRAIETNCIADTHKLNTYWVVFSLILLFEHAFTKLLEWFLLWPYIRLLIIFLLVMPHFDGALYVYKHLICRCLSIDPQIVINWFNKCKASFLRDNFLSEVERYVKENGTEGLEKIIASKSTRTNLDVKEFSAVSSIDNEMSKSINPNGGQNDIKAVQVMAKKKETTASQVLTVNVDKYFSMKMNEKDIEVLADREILKIPPPMEVQKEWTSISSLPTQTDATFSSPLGDNEHKATYEALEIKNETEPKLIWTENCTVAAMEICEKQVEVEVEVEVGTGLEDLESTKEVLKEWTCALCQVSTTCESNLNGHLQGRKHKAAYEALKLKNEAEPKLTWTENRTVAAMEICEKRVEVGTAVEDPESPKEVQKEWTCALCQVTTASERDLNSHLQGRKHKAAYEALKARNQAFVPKIAPALTAKTCNQPNKEPGKSIVSSGSKNENVQGQKVSSPAPITKKQYKLKGNIAIHMDKVQSQQLKPNGVPRVKSSPLWCAICSIRCSGENGEIDLVSHFNGKKHKENLQERLNTWCLVSHLN